MFAPDPERDCDWRAARTSFREREVFKDGDADDIAVSEVPKTDFRCVDDVG